MLIFDGAIAFEPDETAVIWATALDGSRFKLCITRLYAEQVWRIRYSEAAVSIKIWLHIEDLRHAANRANADGRKELVL